MSVSKDYLKGVFYILVSAFSFALMALFVRLSGNVPFVQKTFFRNIVALGITIVSIAAGILKGGIEQYKIPKESWVFLLLRSLGGSLGIFGNFYAIDHLILADASILNKMAPFYTVLFSFLLLKEKIKPVPLAAITTAFCGALLVAKPSFDFSKTLPSLAGVASGFGAGFAYACVRKLGQQKCSGKIVILFFSAFSTLLAVPYMIFNFEPMTAMQTTYLILAGISAAAGQFTITAAYYHAPASKISIFDFCQIIFSASLGFFILGQKPDILSILGYIIILSMAILNFVYNNRSFKNKTL